MRVLLVYSTGPRVSRNTMLVAGTTLMNSMSGISFIDAVSGIFNCGCHGPHVPPVMLTGRPTEQPTSIRCSRSLISKNNSAEVMIHTRGGDDRR